MLYFGKSQMGWVVDVDDVVYIVGVLYVVGRGNIISEVDVFGVFNVENMQLRTFRNVNYKHYLSLSI